MIVDFDDVRSKLAIFDVKSQFAIEKLLTQGAQELESYAKENRPWTDRTAMARKALKSTVSTTNKGFRITLSHGVDYGVFLEMAHEKKYAIVVPTVQTKGSIVVKQFEKLMQAVK